MVTSNGVRVFLRRRNTDNTPGVQIAEHDNEHLIPVYDGFCELGTSCLTAETPGQRFTVNVSIPRDFDLRDADGVKLATAIGSSDQMAHTMTNVQAWFLSGLAIRRQEGSAIQLPFFLNWDAHGRRTRDKDYRMPKCARGGPPLALYELRPSWNAHVGAVTVFLQRVDIRKSRGPLEPSRTVPPAFER
ncbi:hypothetical protein LTR78_007182 [Recurvomyces mirabilis]|uniref:Uncharacterized protein n=1 Tax=Recurvomyces mirabilis TaxID=574656 RepID=A0AAE1BYS6_9PEZI|nr:hypothetical protein LTR78_007182 [Recurvomyces mirabilis]KAK5155575.1 hypothetical protein LTS14_005836 [Recurvomyces mirabilis]